MRFGILCVLALPLFAGENVVLTSGLRLHAQRHELSGSVMKIYTASGIIEMPESAIAGFEAEEYVAPPPPPPAAPASAVQSVEAKRSRSIHELLDDAAVKAGLPPAIVHSVAKAESNYRPDAISNKGARGVMQLMPATAAALQANPDDPQQNTEAGARYLRDLLLKYDGDVAKALAAYNAGPGAVDKYNGVPPYRETVSYVNKVINDYKKRTAAGVAE